MTAPPSALALIRAGFDALTARTFATEGIVEVSMLKSSKGTVVGYFDSPKTAIDALVAAPPALAPEGVYVTLNPLDPALLARAVNRFQEFAKHRATDRDVTRRLWLPFDFDPVRPAGISAMHKEYDVALARADDVERLLTSHGWPVPMRGSGGNSPHLIYAIDLPNDAEIDKLLDKLYLGLAKRFSDEQVKFDTAVKNAARIWTWWGTWKRKGDDTPDRPHRRSQLHARPDPLVLVLRDQIHALIETITPAPSEQTRARSTVPLKAHVILDMAEEFRTRDWYLDDRGNGKHLVRCPWQDEHSGQSGPSETAIFEPLTPETPWGFKCMHTHCASRTIRDVWELFRPPPPSRPPRSARAQTDARADSSCGDASECTAGEAPSESGNNGQSVTLDDFWSYSPERRYLYEPTGDLWPAESVNGRLPKVDVTNMNGETTTIKPSVWLDRHRAIEQMTWAPGEPRLIRDRLIDKGGWFTHQGARVFNLYQPPVPLLDGNPDKAEWWIEHVHQLYPDNATHLISCFAQRVQYPDVKINHAMVLGGAPGIGKDSILEPVLRAVGTWNTRNVSPIELLAQFNEFAKAVILRISEARDLGDANRHALYNHLKQYTAAPPHVLTVNEKYLPTYTIPNVCSVVITTNHRLDSLYLPANDRRHYVTWSQVTMERFPERYWSGFYAWLRREGADHVAAYLATYDLSAFDPKAPPPKTEAFWDLVHAQVSPEAAEIADVVDALEQPLALTVQDLIDKAPFALQEWLRERRSRWAIHHRLADVGYVAVRNSNAKDGLWKLGGRRQVIYVQQSLTAEERQHAVSLRMSSAD